MSQSGRKGSRVPMRARVTKNSSSVTARDGGGWWDTWAIREIADAIDALNKPWHDYMDYSFGCMQRGEKYMDWQEWSEQQKQGE